jgi:response regulator RpfG family c-di-GMP phosphodiesterase
VEGNDSSTRVLIVDDERSVCVLLSEKLSSEGLECQSCSSGEKALALMQGESFDLIISDLHMPGISGLELLEKVRQDYPRSAFLIITGEGDVQVGIKAMKQGAADYLVKPFQLEAVVASVGRALEKKRLEVELENYRQNLEQMVEQRTKQLRTAMRRIEGTYDETLQAMGGALDLRNPATAGHCQRVSQYCLELANGCHCSPEQLRQIARGSYLHDIGKIGIPDGILFKEGALTAEETEVMRTHVRIGYDLVSRIAFLAPAAEIVLTHQERYDGTGYPQGLVGEEIPLGARIFAVADTLDAMTSDRPYRRALPFHAARAEVVRGSGRQFDPEVVRVFLAIPAEFWNNILTAVGGPRAKQYQPSPTEPFRALAIGASAGGLQKPAV